MLPIESLEHPRERKRKREIMQPSFTASNMVSCDAFAVSSYVDRRPLQWTRSQWLRRLAGGAAVWLVAFVFPPTFALAERPTVVVIMVDDLGFSDIGCYGGEIDTPHLDALAARGVRCSQCYNTAKCHSSRVCLLTGQYCIAAGDTSLSHAVTSAEVLGKAGYFTAMTGKWHLKQQPTGFGFQN